MDVVVPAGLVKGKAPTRHDCRWMGRRQVGRFQGVAKGVAVGRPRSLERIPDQARHAVAFTGMLVNEGLPRSLGIGLADAVGGRMLDVPVPGTDAEGEI